MIPKTLELPGHKLHYVDFGGTGPTVVVVHGLGGAHGNWMSVGLAMALRARVVAVDLPGFGLSGRSSGRNDMTTLGDGLALLDAMSPDPVHLVGNSMGGALSISEAHARRGRVASTLLVGPAVPPPRERPHVDRRWMASMLLACVPGGHRLLRRRALRQGPERQVRGVARAVPRRRVEGVARGPGCPRSPGRRSGGQAVDPAHLCGVREVTPARASAG